MNRNFGGHGVKRGLRSGKLLGIAVAAWGTTTGIAQDIAEVPERLPALEEVIVTAQRRSENLQKIPISVTAFGAETLKEGGIVSTTMLTQVVPSVQFTRSGPSGLFFIRGVGTTNAAAGEEGANAFYVDNVYIPDLAQTVSNFNNIERVEVLKGPQGTLFGRNATGGLVHIITRDPGSELVADADVGYASHETSSARLYVGGPLSETVSADIALAGMDQNRGWGRNRTTGGDVQYGSFWGVRSKMLWQPVDTVRIKFAADANETDEDFGTIRALDPDYVGLNGHRAPRAYDTSAEHPTWTNLQNWGASLTAEVDFGAVVLTSISALRDHENDSSLDVDGGPDPLTQLDYRSGTRSFQQEIRLASADWERINWQAGLFYLDAEADTYSSMGYLAPGVQGEEVVSTLDTASYAGFGEISYWLTEKSQLTAGVRYTSDQRDFRGSRAFVMTNGVGLPVLVESELDYEETTWRLAFQHALSDELNLFASVNRGFKGGTYNLQAPMTPAVLPQFITAYEVGIKSELFDNRLRLNVSAYRYDISDYQVRSAAAGGGSSYLLNAAEVDVNGLDVDFEAVPSERWRLFGGMTLLDSRFDEFGGEPVATTPQAPIFYPRPAVCTDTGSKSPGMTLPGPQSGGLLTCFGDVAGKRTPMAPTFAGSVGVRYLHPLAGGAELRVSALYSYNHGYLFEPDGLLEQDAYHLVNASVEYRPTQHWGVELWGNNLGDTEYYTQRVGTPTGSTVNYAAPRTYGITLHYSL